MTKNLYHVTLSSFMPRSVSLPTGAATCSLLLGTLILTTFTARLHAAVQITSTPTVALQPNSPLSGLLEFTTDLPSTVRFRVRSPSDQTWIVQSSTPATTHAIPVHGLMADTNYRIDEIHVDAGGGMTASAGVSLPVATDPLPTGQNFALMDVTTSKPEKMERGYTIVSAAQHTVAYDSSGDVRWYMSPAIGNIELTSSGLWLGRGTGASRGEIHEYDLLGNRTAAWYPSTAGSSSTPGAISVPATGRFHHDTEPMLSGNIMTIDTIVKTITDYPTSYTDPNAKADQSVLIDVITEFDRSGNVVNTWDLSDMLDPRRISYEALRGNPRDWSHSNAVVYDESDDSVIVSVRHQDAVIKFDRGTGDLIWILGPHDNWGPQWQPYLLTPVGSDFEWSYHTHSPQILPDDPSNPLGPDDPDILSLMIHDNGNNHAMPYDGTEILDDSENYTRSVEYRINEATMEIEQVWQYGDGADDVIYSNQQGDSDWLPETNNVLTDFTRPRFINGVAVTVQSSRLVEVTRDGEVVFDATLFDSDDPLNGAGRSYRVERIHSLYPNGEYAVTVVPSPSTAVLALVSTLFLPLACRRLVSSK